MKKIILAAAAILLAACAEKPAFEPYVIENLEPRPDWWQVRPSEISKICSEVKNGRVEIVAKTPLGYPVYAVLFGDDFDDAAPQTNWSAGNSSSSVGAYLGEGCGKQTLMFVAGIHGSEPESVAAAVNMIKLLDTGRDLRGLERPEFVELASHYRFIIMPCVNMDGRSISPDHFRGQPYEIFRGCSQGWWKDGSLIGWLGSKEYFPLPLDKVKYPGGYPNSEGYNIQHDATPGDIKTEEAKGILRTVAKYRVDCLLNGHSCEYDPFIIALSNVETPEHFQLGNEIVLKANTAMFERGLLKNIKSSESVNTLNITNLVNWCSGGLGLTLECCHACGNEAGIEYDYTFDEMMEPCFIAWEVIMKEGLSRSLSCRPVKRGVLY